MPRGDRGEICAEPFDNKEYVCWRIEKYLIHYAIPQRKKCRRVSHKRKKGKEFWFVEAILPSRRFKGASTILSLYGKIGYYSRKWVKFTLTLITQKSKTLYFAAGFFQLSNLLTACQSLHFAKISQMKSLSKPRLPIKIYTIRQNLPPEEFRKKARRPLTVFE